MGTIKTIDQLMTKYPISIGYEDRIEQASELMIEHRCRHLPVTDQTGEVIGVLSDRDIQRAMEVRKRGVEIEVVLVTNRKVRDFMSWPPHTIKDITPLTDAVRVLIAEKISALLVTSSRSGKVCGIVTTEDVLKEFLKTLETTAENAQSMFPPGKT